MAAREKKEEAAEGAGRPSSRIPKNRLAADCKLDGRVKTKTNFKLSIVAPPKVSRPRGRPPGRPRVAADAPAAETPEAPATPTAKTRARKKADVSVSDVPDKKPEGEVVEDAPETAEPAPNAGPGRPPKAGALKRLVKKKRLVTVLAKKKGLITKRALKPDAKKAKAVRKPKITVKTEPDVDVEAEVPTIPEIPPLVAEIKKDPDAPEVPDSPLPSLESRSSSPRAGSVRRSRTGSDVPSTPELSNSITKSPYSTRSERSNSPFPDSAQKAKPGRKPRSVKASLLGEVVDQENKKKRLLSETRDPKSDSPDADTSKKAKRLRSFSKDGSEISKCSDVADSDISEPVESFIKSEIKTEEPPVEQELKLAAPEPEIEGEPKPADAEIPDPENNNTKSETDETQADSESQNPTEKIADKFLILNNMSKTFNDISPTDKTKSIRRSVRQRKGAAKTAEQDSSDVKEKENSEVDENEKSTDCDEPVDTQDNLDNNTEEAEAEVEVQPPQTEGGNTEPAEDGNEEGEHVDEASKENVQNYNKSFTPHDIDQLIHKLKNFEEQDRKRQEIAKLNAEKRPVMVTSDVVLIPKTNVDKAAKDSPNVTIEKPKESSVNNLDVDSSVTIVRKEQLRKSLDIDLPSSVTLIKRTGSISRKRSISSNSKEDDSVIMIDKSLGKEIALKSVLPVDGKLLTNNLKSKKESPPKVPQSDSDPERRASSESKPEAANELFPDETPEKRREKEKVLKTLGLLTLEAANRAKLEKQKQKELNKNNKNSVTKPTPPNDVYTGTLKTVIKLSRPNSEKKRGRSPLKMTFQKSKSRTNKLSTEPLSGESESDENPCYTLLHKETGGSSSGSTGAPDNHLTSGGHRKSHYSNRFNNHDIGIPDRIGDSTLELNASGKESVTNLVIPEKASSFGIHPERLCQDQCFYCGGKFGLFDTPCHIAQIKSSDRQRKILENEEKLTIDSCLCDACFRHVDRRANCPSYKRRAVSVPSNPPAVVTNSGDTCYAQSCSEPAPHTLRRKWLVKIKRSISKVVQLDLDYPGLHTIPLCESHYNAVTQLIVCGLCKRRLSRHQVHYINQEYRTLNPLLRDQGLPIVLDEKPVVCKLCRYFCTLLLRPALQQQVNKKDFLKKYRKRLMHTLNLEVPEDTDSENTDEPSVSPSELNADQVEPVKIRKKRGRKPNENHKSDENCLNSSKTSENGKKSETESSINQLQVPKTEIDDIESLINSNKIPVPGCKSSDNPSSPSSNPDYENPIIRAMDKQAELQNLLKNCNVPPSTILERIGITDPQQKSKNILKVHNAPVVSKKKNNRHLRRIQKLGQIITQKEDFEETLNCKIPNREDFTIEPMNVDGANKDSPAILRNIALNDECTIETLPPKLQRSSGAADITSMKNKWQMTESFTQVKKNLSALSKNLPDKRKNHHEISNPVRRLETNPSISVRELFPGEEEMNLQCSIEFNNLKGVTPEGWERCNTTIQYDKHTKKLWHELQKPYGNQSSFLRHLILLEKYFRNGDLILSPNANTNAMTYSESVQNRLRSFDNHPTNGDQSFTCTLNRSLSAHLDLNTPKPTENPEFRKPPVMNVGAGKSLLKSNQINPDCSKKKCDGPKVSKSNGEANGVPKSSKGMPVSLAQLERLGNQLTPLPIAPRPPTPRPDTLKSMEKIAMNPSEVKTSTPKSDTVKPKASSVPPELIAIGPQIAQKKNMENVLKNIQMAKNASQTGISKSFSAISPVSSTAPKKLGKEIKRLKGSKQWRPTLIPITSESKSRSDKKILHQTADGRRLPSLVQVTMGGTPYHITIEDYNRMCIMRREKLQQMQKDETHKGGSNSIEITDQIKLDEKARPPEDISKIVPELDATTSLLKSVTLKNITIAPIAPEVKNPQSLLISNNAKSAVPSPPKKPETIINNSEISNIVALSPKSATSMPKIPKSLTVIPQMIASATPLPAPVSPGPASLLPITTTVAQSEP